MSKESAYFQLKDITGKHDTKELKRELDTFHGVVSVSVNPQKNSLAVDFDNSGVKTEQLVKKLESLGYEIERQESQQHIM